jgi:hypothetical protein
MALTLIIVQLGLDFHFLLQNVEPDVQDGRRQEWETEALQPQDRLSVRCVGQHVASF